MRRAIGIISLILTLFHGFLFADSTQVYYRALYDSIWNLTPDFERTASVTNFNFEMDAARYKFSEGNIILLPDMAGKNIGFYYDGEAVCSLSAPTPVEKFSIKKFTGKEEFVHEFQHALFLYSPDIYLTYFDSLEYTKGQENRKNRSGSDNLFNKLKDYSIDIGAYLIPPLFTSAHSPMLFALTESKGRRYIFLYDPTATESVQVYEMKREMGYNIAQVITSFFPREHYQSGGNIYEREQVETVFPLHYDMDIGIEKNTDLKVRCRLAFQSNQDSLMGINFTHAELLDMDSIENSSGEKCALFDKIDDDYDPFTNIILDRPLKKGEIDTVTFFYHSKDVIRKSEWGDFYILAPSGWYPLMGYRNKATYKLSYRTPEWLRLLSCGEKVIDTVQGDWRFTEWLVNDPVKEVGFNYGWFDSLTFEQPGVPTVHVFRSAAGHVGRLFGEDMLDLTARDISATLEFCGKMLGCNPCDELIVTEIPMLHGQSFPGLLHLGWHSFEAEYSAKMYETDAFRAHEVAHQWWGTLVQFKSYHDQWLSEGFAEYTSAWFMQAKDENNKRFLDMLDDWKDIITQKGSGTRGVWSEGSKAGPIWLGHRLASTKSEDYTTLVYAKGAFVLHMLRMMLHDYKTHSDENFIRMMKQYVSAYAGRSASTHDFQEITERYFNMDMDWFFNQWIFGMDIPRYKARYEVIPEGDKYILQVTVTQKEVPEDFKMVMPLVVEFENKTHTILKFWVDGPETIYRSAPFPYKPKKYTLNPYSAVLCHVD